MPGPGRAAAGVRQTRRMAVSPADVERSLAGAVARLLGAAVVGLRPVTGGYTDAVKRIASLADGRSVFVKAAGDPRTRGWLRAEHEVYAFLGSRPFLPQRLGWEDAAVSVLVLEDLSAARWPPPWSPADVVAVRDALDGLHAVRLPPGWRRPQDADDLRGGWRAVAADRDPFLALGLCSAAWLARALPRLAAAAERAQLDGDRLVHLDVRSDNLCLRDGGCVLVDWASAARGNPLLELALWLPTLEVEGGPPPDPAELGGMVDLTAVFAGYLASRAGLPEPADVPPPGVRGLQRATLRVALVRAAEGLGLPAP